MYYLNIDFLYYLIYLFFRSIWNTITSIFSFSSVNDIDEINLWDLIKYLTSSDYSRVGEGIISRIDGYSLFTPPNGFNSWGNNFWEALTNWFSNFFHNPYCPSCYSFFDLIFGGINSLFWSLSLLILVLLWFLKDKEKRLEKMDKEKYEPKEEEKKEKDKKMKVKKSENIKILKNKIKIKKKEKTKENINYNSVNKKSLIWDEAMELLKSDNMDDWKKAIILVNEILEMTFDEEDIQGINLWEKIKKANFKNKETALEVYRISILAKNNFYKISKDEAEKVIKKYSEIFQEFYH